MTSPDVDPAAAFDDLLSANRDFASAFDRGGLEAPARAGVGVVTCMDSRIDPLALLGLGLGDAKVVRNPGGQVTDAALDAMILGVHLLGVHRIMVVPHTRCAMASATEAQLRERVGASAGADASAHTFGVIADPMRRLHDDVDLLRRHPLIGGRAAVGGFVYDVDTGLLTQHV